MEVGRAEGARELSRGSPSPPMGTPGSLGRACHTSAQGLPVVVASANWRCLRARERGAGCPRPAWAWAARSYPTPFCSGISATKPLQGVLGLFPEGGGGPGMWPLVSAYFRVVVLSICPPLSPRAGTTPRAVDKLSGFLTEKKGSWGVSLRSCVHSPLEPPQLQNPSPAQRPACPCNLSWSYCDLRRRRMSAHIWSSCLPPG